MDKARKASVICISILMAAALFTGGCLIMRRYSAQADFTGGTWINGLYCAGKSIQEVNASLIGGRGIQEITVYDRQGNASKITAAVFGEPGKADSLFSYEEDLKNISRMQKARAGRFSFLQPGKKEYEAKPLCTNPAQLEEMAAYMAKTLPAFQTAGDAGAHDVRLFMTEDGYELKNGKENRLNVQKAAAAIYHAIVSGRETLDLWEAGCYETFPYTPQEERLLMLWEKIDAFQNLSITYLFGEEKEVVDAAVLARFIALCGKEETKEGKPSVQDGAYEYTEEDFLLDETGALQTDRRAIEEYVNALAKRYDTLGNHTFQATRGEQVIIEGGTYGNQLDQKAEADYLEGACMLARPQVREPVYKHQALYQGRDDIGDTYIEIDMGRQVMYYYKEGKLRLETPVVTGNTGKKMGTPARVCYVYNKQRNRVLRGQGYASPVKYWMPVNGNIGIHDASWRSEFGGEIYKTDGSHGCINTPGDAMAELYDVVEIGTPVVMFY